jgi:hypothetical protein
LWHVRLLFAYTFSMGERSVELVSEGREVPVGMNLRTELSVRGLKYALRHGYLHERTDGRIPSILFGCDEEGRHGNFYAASYAAILERAEWARRLEKVHTGYRRARVRANWSWKELDCSNSSDALLMNIFCAPGVTRLRAVRALLGSEVEAVPEFGYKPRTPLANGRWDCTEIDMRLGSLLVEAKLTESDFQMATPRLVRRYREVEEVFEVEDLPLRKGRHVGYQLIRGALAAQAGGGSFCALCDGRRTDLTEGWWGILRAVRSVELRCRLKLLTWQELAGAVPVELREFLEEKYGIVPSGLGD